MNGEICLQCMESRLELMETVVSGKNPPRRMVFLRLWCGGGIMSSERVGMQEYIDGAYAIPDTPYSTVIDKSMLSRQMLDDYDDALKRMCSKMSCFNSGVIPPGCHYQFEHEMTELCEE